MTKEKMNWKSEQDRWQKDYKRRTLYIPPSKLGGTCRQDTVVAANRWFEEQKARIDAEDAIKRFRPNEREHIDELARQEEEIKKLRALQDDPAMRPIVTPAIELSKAKIAKIKEELKHKKLSSLTDTLRSPLSLSEMDVETVAEQEAFEKMFGDMLEAYERNNCSDEWMACNDYYRYHHFMKFDFDELENRVAAEIDSAQKFGILSESCREYLEEMLEKIVPPTDEQSHERLVHLVVDLKNYFLMRLELKLRFEERHLTVARKKKEIGAIDDYSRGIIDQSLNVGNLYVPDTKLLVDHIKKFADFQEDRYKSRKIRAGQLGQITGHLKYYRSWTESIGAKNVDIVGTKEHTDAYFAFVLNDTRQKGFSQTYANKIFAVFKRFVWFLIDEKTLPSFVPPWEGRRDDKYTFKIKKKGPEILSLDSIRTVYAVAPPRVRLFLLLVMNCGFGQAEIGGLEKCEYDPDKGIIKHKRIKTEEHKNVPTVTYQLWGRTKEMLDHQIDVQKKYPQHVEHRHLLLLNEDGKPLWTERFENGKHLKSDNITCQFKRFVGDRRKMDSDFPKCAFYMFRRTASTLIYNSEDFSNLDWLFLGHAPKTTAGQHYSVALDDKLNSCLKWLEGAFFGEEN